MSTLSYEKISINVGLRIKVALGICTALFFLVILRLWYLQILRGDYFRDRSENNRLRTVFLAPPRGNILDRHGRVLVRNRPAFNIDLVTEDSLDPQQTVRNLAQILGLDPEALVSKVTRPQRKRRRFEAKLILKDMSRDMLARVVARRHALPGVQINVVPAREYVYGEFATHALGYIREVTSGELESASYSGYRSGDLVGKSGVEKAQEYLLHGQRGVRQVIVNALGTRIGESYFEAERAGHNVTATLDYDLQLAAEKGLKDQTGAVVALNPHTGEVLAMVSHPGFDPNIFTGELTPEVWRSLVFGEENRLNNRAVQGLYPPGSVFKMIMATAGLAEEVISPQEFIRCPGYFRVGRSRLFRCHKKAGHGLMNLKNALKQSCNVYFYTVGQRLGVDRIHAYATHLGLGLKTGLGLVEEPAGLIPSTEWKRTYFMRAEDKKWYPGETPSVSIGQGAVVVTPLQVARALAALVNGGKVMRPYIVSKIESHDGSFKDESFAPEQVDNVGADPKVLKHVREGLFAVVNEAGGTGRRARLDEKYGVTVGGKTGTAQLRNTENMQAESKDLAWFAGYAPADKAELVVVALVEAGGHGGVTAAPIVRQVMEAYFKDRVRAEEIT